MLKVLKIDRKLRDTVSTQIANYIRSLILDHKIKPGDRLLNTTEIMAQIRVGTNTVVDALAILQEEGFLDVGQGRGTFVSQHALSLKMASGAPRHKVSRVALSSAFADLSNPLVRKNDCYRGNSVYGFLEECSHQGIMGLILTEETTKEQSVGRLHETLLESKCDGLVWLYPEVNDWAKIRYLQEKKFPLVVTRRSHVNDQVACVESDEFRAGILAADYLVQKGCQELVVFNYFDSNSEDPLVRANLPLGLNEGLKTGLDRCRNLSADVIKEVYTKKGGRDPVAIIKKTLKGLKPDSGIVFTSGIDFFKFMYQASPEEIALIDQSEVIVSATRQWVMKFAPLVKDIDFQVIVAPFDEVMGSALQKLVNMIEDKRLDTTTTLIDVVFTDFWQYWKNEVGLEETP